MFEARNEHDNTEKMTEKDMHVKMTAPRVISADGGDGAGTQ
jgi:hypothetical protein